MLRNDIVAAVLLSAPLLCPSPGRADDGPKTAPPEQARPSTWTDPRSSPTPAADTGERSRDRRSALEERVRYLEEQAARLARDLEAERLRQTELKANAEAAKRDADDLRTRVLAEQEKVRKLTRDAQTRDPPGRARPVQSVRTETKPDARRPFTLPSVLQPIRF